MENRINQSTGITAIISFAIVACLALFSLVDFLLNLYIYSPAAIYVLKNLLAAASYIFTIVGALVAIFGLCTHMRERLVLALYVLFAGMCCTLGANLVQAFAGSASVAQIPALMGVVARLAALAIMAYVANGRSADASSKMTIAMILLICDVVLRIIIVPIVFRTVMGSYPRFDVLEVISSLCYVAGAYCIAIIACKGSADFAGAAWRSSFSEGDMFARSVLPPDKFGSSESGQVMHCDVTAMGAGAFEANAGRKPLFCSKCGARLASGAAFCQACGAKAIH